jgi:hypothetical protein
MLTRYGKILGGVGQMRGRRRAILADTAVWNVFVRDPPLETGAPAPEVGTYRWVGGSPS